MGPMAMEEHPTELICCGYEWIFQLNNSTLSDGPDNLALMSVLPLEESGVNNTYPRIPLPWILATKLPVGADSVESSGSNCAGGDLTADDVDDGPLNGNTPILGAPGGGDCGGGGGCCWPKLDGAGTICGDG